MKSITLSVLLLIALVAGASQMPLTQQYLSTALSIYGLPSQDSYGAKLGVEIDAAVKNIHARVQGARISQLDVLTIMCMETAHLVGKRKNITSSAGARGLTQVMPGTLRDYARSRKGGFYLPDRPDLLYRDSRFSIEAGALIFNHHLMNYVPKYGEMGGRRAAAIAYNGGPGRVGKSSIPAETRKYAYEKLPRCYNQLRRGQSPVNSSIWRTMVAKVAELTGGTMLMQGQGVASDIPSLAWAPTTDSSPIQAVSQPWWQSPAGQAVARQQYQPQNAAFSPTKSSWFDKIFKSEAVPQAPSTPVLKCSESGGETSLQWSCPSGTSVSKGTASHGAFSTRGAGTGLIKVPIDYSLMRVTYTVQCLKGHQVLREGKCTRVSGGTSAATKI